MLKCWPYAKPKMKQWNVDVEGGHKSAADGELIRMIADRLEKIFVA